MGVGGGMAIRALGRWLGVVAWVALSQAPQAVCAEGPATDRAAAVPPRSVPRASVGITIDGSIEDAEWRGALAVPLLFETRPGENVSPPVETECLIAYDDGHLYVAFRAHDPRPQEIRAHLSDRDSAWDDDFVGIVLDPFNDERRAFEFFVNPLGIQMDSFYDDVGGVESESWDAIWDAAGRITERGYEVELAIPFHQLRFPRTSGQQVWGFDALRFYPRGQRYRIASQPMDRGIDCYLCQVSKMQGFEGASAGRNLEIAPTLTAGRTDEREDFPDGDLDGGSSDAEAGLTVRWGLTPNLTLGATVNPDFSQVEADSAQLDVNTRFALFFEERRPFFLEGEDFFRTPLEAVFTRNVADPEWGLKLTGKEGPNGIGVFAAQDRLTNVIFPGSQGSSSTSLDMATTDSALRYRRDFGRSSAIGALATSRQGDGYSNVVTGLDGKVRLTDADAFQFQLLSSTTEYPDPIAQRFGQPQGSFDDHALLVHFDHEGRDWLGYAYYEEVGEGFRADMGFLPKVGYRQYIGGLTRVWWGGEGDWWTVTRAHADWDLTEDQSGQMLERELEAWFEFGGPKQSWVWVDAGVRDTFFNGVTFDGQRFFNFFTEIEPNGSVWLSLEGGLSEAVDFANTQEGDLVELNPELRWNLGQHLRITWDHLYRTLDVEGGRLFEANLSQLRMVYQFNPRTFVRAILQHQKIDRDPSLYDDASAVKAEDESLFSQLLFSYKLNPQTVLFAGYSDNRVGDQDLPPTLRDRSLFFKLGYAWNI